MPASPGKTPAEPANPTIHPPGGKQPRAPGKPETPITQHQDAELQGE